MPPNFHVFLCVSQELGIKHPLHRKKLVLAVKAVNAKQEEKSALLDHIWVTRKDRHMHPSMSLAAPQGRQRLPRSVCLEDRPRLSPWERQLDCSPSGGTAGTPVVVRGPLSGGRAHPHPPVRVNPDTPVSPCCCRVAG